MTKFVTRLRLMATVVVVGMTSVAADAAALNVLPSSWANLESQGTYGVLRPGSPWEPAPGLATQNTILDDVLLPVSTQWNIGTWWWDQALPANGSTSQPMGVRIDLTGARTVNRFVVQADDNDTYQLDYWDGVSWHAAWTIPAVGGFGMQTRDSGILPAVTLSRLRFYAVGGDEYYSVSEIQAFSVPEPATTVLMGLGMALWAGISRTRQRRQPSSVGRRGGR